MALETVYPSTCALCARRGSWLCDSCAPDWVPILPALCCDRCGHPILGRTCECRSMHPAIIRARAVATYSGWPAASLHKVKYERERDRAHYLAARMMEPLTALGQIDVLVPVPLHAERLEWRGFNQSQVLARHLTDLVGTTVELALERVKPTESQTRLNREQRMANIDGAMAISPGWRADPARHYVLIDDVYTTGTTIGACAEQLSRAGATRISALTFAFDLQPNDLEAYRRLVSAASP